MRYLIQTPRPVQLRDHLELVIRNLQFSRLHCTIFLVLDIAQTTGCEHVPALKQLSWQPRFEQVP